MEGSPNGFDYCCGANIHDAAPVYHHAADFDDLCRQIVALPRNLPNIIPKESDGRYICAPLRANGADTFHRCEADALPRGWFGSDVDGASPEDANEILVRLRDYSCIWWHTRSHTPRCPRLRIVLALSRPVFRGEDQRLGLGLETVLGADLASVKWDRSVYPGEHAHYLPFRGVETNREYGEPVDVDAVLALVPPEARHPPAAVVGDRIAAGGRDRTLTSLAGTMRRRGMGEAAIYAALEVVNREQCDPPLPEREVRRIARSVGRYPPVGHEQAHRGNGKDTEEPKVASEPKVPPEEPPDPWPAPLEAVAYHGLAGEIVKAIEPNTEADPVALLVQTLLSFGATLGRTAYYQVEEDKHYGNLFALLIGETSKARKGTSWGRIRAILSLIDNKPKWTTGLSTGEGLKYQVRDPAPIKPKKFKKSKKFVDDDEDEDPGVSDKRLIIIQTEFGETLRVAARQASTLTAAMRDAWDTGNLSTLTKHDPLTATDAHISVIGHITAPELRAGLTEVDAANGFANRFLMVCVRRSKILPEGGEPLEEAVAHGFARRLARCAGLAEGAGRVPRTEEAAGLWASVYPALTAGGVGLTESVLGRAEAQVTRLSLLYALLDESRRVDAVHIEAALALWKYCDDSARYVFGGGLAGARGLPEHGDLVAEKILRWLKGSPQGLGNNEIRDLFNRNLSAERIGSALEALQAAGRVRSTRVEAAGGGKRPKTLWQLTVN